MVAAVTFEVAAKLNVARTDLARVIHHLGVDGYLVELHQFFAHGQQIELPLGGRSLAYAVAEQHIEFQILSHALSDKACDIHPLDKGEHWVRGLFHITNYLPRDVSWGVISLIIVSCF